MKKEKAIKIAFVDDHDLLRKGICDFLGDDDSFEILFEAYPPYEVHIDLGLFGLYFCLHERLSRQTRSDAVDHS